jgi:hypothetical protein
LCFIFAVEEMIPASKKSKRTCNPIRNIVDNLNPPQNHPKRMLNLALGDPTVHGNLFCPTVLNDAIHDLLTRATGKLQLIPNDDRLKLSFS